MAGIFRAVNWAEATCDAERKACEINKIACLSYWCVITFNFVAYPRRHIFAVTFNFTINEKLNVMALYL